MGRSAQPIADKPLGVIDLLDGAFAALRQRPGTIVAIVLGMIVPVSLFRGWVTRDDLGGASFTEIVNDPVLAQETSSQPFAAYDVPFFIGETLSLLVTSVAGVALARIVNAWFEGRDESAGDALRYIARRAWAVLGAFVVVHVVQLVGFVLLVVPGVVLIVLSSLTSPALAIEGLGPIAAMRRSWELVRRRPGPVVVVLILVAIVQYLVSQAIEVMPALAALFLGPDRAWPLLSVALLASQVIIVPFNSAAMCLLYLDIRFRTEGLDLQQRMHDEFDAVAQDGLDDPQAIGS